MEGKKRLVDWLFSVEVMDLSECVDCTKASRNWFQEIIKRYGRPLDKRL